MQCSYTVHMRQGRACGALVTVASRWCVLARRVLLHRVWVCCNRLRVRAAHLSLKPPRILCLCEKPRQAIVGSGGSRGNILPKAHATRAASDSDMRSAMQRWHRAVSRGHASERLGPPKYGASGGRRGGDAGACRRNDVAGAHFDLTHSVTAPLPVGQSRWEPPEPLPAPCPPALAMPPPL